MSDIMRPIPFESMIEWVFTEFNKHQTIFDIPYQYFYFYGKNHSRRIFGELLESPLGPAAGPHTQLAQNILASYLVGGRFMELKTVQKLDHLQIEKPCIDGEDEGYNVEWSQELNLDQSLEEYVKAWFLIHLVKAVFGPSQQEERGFIFNMSVGYDLKGIQTERMDWFIESLKDASKTKIFNTCHDALLNYLRSVSFKKILRKVEQLNRIQKISDEIWEEIRDLSPHISKSVTLSTMHGCPPEEIEAICKYLLEEKGLHTYVKLNPTLLRYEIVESMLYSLGYKYIHLDRHSFENDLQFDDAIPMLERLTTFAKLQEREFGVKLSNTLGLLNHKHQLPGEEMYLSGRALYPLTINLAGKLAKAMDGQINISYSGGVTVHNVVSIYETGIYPITLVTDLLKPGGYSRLRQMAERIENLFSESSADRTILNINKMQVLARTAVDDPRYLKETREINSIKIDKPLPRFDCYIAPCREACPIHQDVPEYIRLVEEGRYQEACEVIISSNPLPHITGHICDHQCMFHCTRWDYEYPVLIRDMKKVAAEQGFSEVAPKGEESDRMNKNSCQVAVFGAGPAGLSVAYFLAKAGFRVTVFERRKKAGGTVQNVIPEFRLPQSAIDKDIRFIQAQGVKFEFEVTEKFSISAIKQKGFKYIFIGIGAGLSNTFEIAGDNEKILNAIEFLWDYHVDKNISLGETVAVIGGGNSAMDGARTALRCPGVEKVYIIYRRTKEFMPADKEEFDAALLEGVIFKELLLPVEFTENRLKCQKMELAEKDIDGRRKVIPVENEFSEFKVDTIISAVGEHVDTDILRENGITLTPAGQVIVSPKTLETEVKNVFIGGDALRGPSTVVESIADGKKVAKVIMQRENIALEAGPDFSHLFDEKTYLLDLIQRKALIHDQDLQNEKSEAGRCLGCNFICNKCVDVCPNRANVTIQSKAGNGKFKDHYQILHIDGLCNECGNCETFCPYQGSPYRGKLTLFWSEEDFDHSGNDGFYLEPDGDDSIINFKVRYNSGNGRLTFDSNGSIVRSPVKDVEQNPDFKKFTDLIFNVYQNYGYLFLATD